MSDKLWRVHVDFETYVRAESEQDADDVVRWNLGDMQDDAAFYARVVRNVPRDWKHSLPWGDPPPGEKVLTCAELLEAGQTELVAGAKPEQSHG